MKMPGEVRVKSALFWIVGLGLIVWNAVLGPAALATFAVGLTLCGIPGVVKLDQLLKVPGLLAADEPKKEPVS